MKALASNATPARLTIAPRIQNALSLLWAWGQIAAERRRLAQLSNDDLADMGINETDARLEAARPFWDLPRGRTAF